MAAAGYLGERFGLEGSVALVIGASGVLGGAMATGLGRAGARIAAAGRSADKVEAAVGRLADLGVIDDAAASSPQAFSTAAAEVLGRVGPRLRQLREDPELHQLAADPEVVYLLEQGQVLSLLRHPGFQRVVSRVLSEEATL